MLEILFFAILSGYLFFRVWSVLGTRTGFEKTFDPPSKEMVDVTPKASRSSEPHADNVIRLPKRLSVNDERTYHPTLNTNGFEDVLKQIQSHDPSFSMEEFMIKASMAFEMITHHFAEGEKKALQELLTPKVYTEFEKVIDQRNHVGEHVSNDIVGPIYSKISSIEMLAKKASITLILTSDQRYITYDSNGKILDNPEKITLKITSAWTFERDFSKKADYTWRLSQTKART